VAITNGYCTLAEVKAALRLTDSTDDTLLEKSIEGASRRIDGYCGRFFYQTTKTISVPLSAASSNYRNYGNLWLAVYSERRSRGLRSSFYSWL